eukprot:31030-Pelagococcus_subviridis.AAC.1
MRARDAAAAARASLERASPSPPALLSRGSPDAASRGAGRGGAHELTQRDRVQRGVGLASGSGRGRERVGSSESRGRDRPTDRSVGSSTVHQRTVHFSDRDRFVDTILEKKRGEKRLGSDRAGTTHPRAFAPPSCDANCDASLVIECTVAPIFAATSCVSGSPYPGGTNVRGRDGCSTTVTKSFGRSLRRCTDARSARATRSRSLASAAAMTSTSAASTVIRCPTTSDAVHADANVIPIDASLERFDLENSLFSSSE